MIRFNKSYVLPALMAVAFAAGCQPTEPASNASTNAAATPAVSAFKFLNAALAKSVPASGEIDAVTTFAPNDTIQAVAVLEGKEGTAQIKVEILDKDGNKVSEGTNSGAVVLKAAIPVEFKAPEGGWAPGAYVAKFYMDGVPNWELQFTVAP